MSDAKPQPEPSMEEIIASISRIIAEDKTPEDRNPREKKPGAFPAASGEVSDVLELTQAVNDDGSVRDVTPRSQDGAEAAAQSKSPASGAAAPDAGDFDCAAASAPSWLLGVTSRTEPSSLTA